MPKSNLSYIEKDRLGIPQVDTSLGETESTWAVYVTGLKRENEDLRDRMKTINEKSSLARKLMENIAFTKHFSDAELRIYNANQRKHYIRGDDRPRMMLNIIDPEDSIDPVYAKLGKMLILSKRYSHSVHIGARIEHMRDYLERRKMTAEVYSSILSRKSQDILHEWDLEFDKRKSLELSTSK